MVQNGWTLALVQVFGRRNADTIHALLRPASKKRQGTKSRDVWRGSAMCRFLDAGMPTLSTRSCGRRPKSAKARNRGTYGGAVPRVLWGFCRRFRLAEVGL